MDRRRGAEQAGQHSAGRIADRDHEGSELGVRCSLHSCPASIPWDRAPGLERAPFLGSVIQPYRPHHRRQRQPVTGSARNTEYAGDARSPGSSEPAPPGGIPPLCLYPGSRRTGHRVLREACSEARRSSPGAGGFQLIGHSSKHRPFGQTGRFQSLRHQRHRSREGPGFLRERPRRRLSGAGGPARQGRPDHDARLVPAGGDQQQPAGRADLLRLERRQGCSAG